MSFTPPLPPQSHLHIRKAAACEDLADIKAIFDAARQIMVESGNTRQWSQGYPSAERVVADIRQGGGYVIEQDGKLVAYFTLLPSPEPTYASIYEGQWMDDTLPYLVVHRLASYKHVHGIFDTVMRFCKGLSANLRIDTHRDNLIMRHNILKHGFNYCGIIHLANGDERLAYQWMG